MRSTLSPAFTGSKMRMMFEFIRDVNQQRALSIKKEIAPGGEKIVKFDEISIKITVDAIASCAFGIEVDSFENPDNVFQKVVKRIMNFTSFSTTMKFIGYMLFPKVMMKLGISLFGQECSDFFKGVITDTMKTREKEGIVRNDLIDLLLKARKGQLPHTKENEEKATDGFATVQESEIGKATVNRVWTDDDMAAQCFIFFMGGFLPVRISEKNILSILKKYLFQVAHTLTFMAYELVANQDVQKKLYEEILTMNTQLNGAKITYEQMQSLKYLDQVVCETLRKWPGNAVKF